MPAFPLGKMGNFPGPHAQGGPPLLKGLLKIKEKGGKEKKVKKERKRDRRDRRTVKKK